MPFLNVFKPYQAIREIYNASEPGIVPDGGFDWRGPNAPMIVKTWWALFLFMNLSKDAVAKAGDHADTPGAFQFVAAASIVYQAISITAMLLAAWLVWTVSQRQIKRAAILGLG